MEMFKPKIMASTEPHVNQWLIFLGDLLPWATIFGLSFTAIDRVFKYFSQAQDARLKQMIKDEVTPQIESLTTAIDNLREEIGRLKAKL